MELILVMLVWNMVLNTVCSTSIEYSTDYSSASMEYGISTVVPLWPWLYNLERGTDHGGASMEH
jgi:hypothetical protein